jgi:predicted ATPase/DNA-binding CsgD family transcriptional regulator
MHTSFATKLPEVVLGSMAQVLHLPLAAPNLVSRDKEVAYLTEQLTGETRLLTIIGPGGVGKTHLAIQAAWQLQDSFERIVFVDVSSNEASQFTAVLLQALGQATSDKDSFGQLCYVMSQKKTLLVIDNFETVLDAAPVVSKLLITCSSLVTLVTSRSQLGLRLETCMPLQPLSALPQDAPALHFFMAAAKTMNPPYALKEHSDDIYKLCERLDGLPLALELAAACIPFMTPKALLDHLEQHASLPQLVLPDRPERQQNLVALVSSSLSLLSEGEQAFFRRLGAMVGSFSIEAAEAVTDAKTLGLETLSTLVKLRNHSLLTSELTTPPRFKMLETIRAVALELLSSSSSDDTASVSEASTTRSRHLHYYQAFTNSHEEHLKGATQLETLGLFAREQGNVRAALRWNSQTNEATLKELGVQLAVSMYHFWHLKGQIQEGQTWLAAFRGDYSAPLQAKWLHALALAKYSLDQQQEAIPLAKEALRLAHALKQKPLAAKTLNLLGNAHRNLDALEKALEYFQEAKSLAKECGDTATYAASVNNIGLLHKHFGRYDKAGLCHQEALHLARILEDKIYQALFINNIALLSAPKERIPLLEEALELLRQVGDSKRMSLSFINLADAHYWLGNYQQAVNYSEEGLACAKQAGDRLNAALNLNNLGILARQQGDLPRAESYFREALELFRAVGSRSREAEVLCEWARCYTDDPPRAAKQFLLALEIALETKALSFIISCLDGLAELEVKENQLKQALLIWSAAKKLLQEHSPKELISEALLEHTRQSLDPELAQTAWQQGQTLSPEQLYRDLCKRWDAPGKRTLSEVLSVRQQDILKLVAQGYSSKKMAKVFGLSEPTIKYHLKEIFDKLGVNSRAEAVAQASQRGLL